MKTEEKIKERIELISLDDYLTESIDIILYNAKKLRWHRTTSINKIVEFIKNNRKEIFNDR